MRTRRVALVVALVLVVAGVSVGLLEWRGRQDPSRLDFGVDVAVAPDGTIYVADRADDTVLAVDGEHLREVVDDSSAGPLMMIAIDIDGRILLAGSDERVIRVAQDGTPETIVDDLDGIRDVDVAADGSIYVVGGIPARLLRIAPDGTRSQVAGPVDPAVASPPSGYVPTFTDGISEVALDSDGALVVLSSGRLWRVPVGSEPVLVAGSADPLAETGDGDGDPGEHALIDGAYALTVNEGGFLFCDDDGRHVRRVDRQGTVNRLVSLSFSDGCVDLAPVPGTADVVVMDDEGRLQRVSPDGQAQQILAG